MRHSSSILGQYDSKAYIQMGVNVTLQCRLSVRRCISFTAYLQCKNHGPALSVTNRKVVLSPTSPVFTTSRMIWHATNQYKRASGQRENHLPD